MTTALAGKSAYLTSGATTYQCVSWRLEQVASEIDVTNINVVPQA